jgi:quercetin dioxygenase-like cupin family protein
MKIQTAGSIPTTQGAAEWFTGHVRYDVLFSVEPPSSMAGYAVTFDPGARTAWHTHPLGQTLIITAGAGWVQRDGEPAQWVRPGDVVRFAPNERHWHGATATTSMTHIAIQEALDGSVVTWLEHVADADFTGPVA